MYKNVTQRTQRGHWPQQQQLAAGGHFSSGTVDTCSLSWNKIARLKVSPGRITWRKRAMLFYPPRSDTLFSNYFEDLFIFPTLNSEMRLHTRPDSYTLGYGSGTYMYGYDVHWTMTRGNTYKLQKFTCHYINLRKYSFCSRVVWNSLPNEVVGVGTINILKNCVDK